MTALKNENLTTRLMLLGCMDCLAKPFTSDVLLQRVNEVFKRIDKEKY